jgi:predicted esterase
LSSAARQARLAALRDARSAGPAYRGGMRTRDAGTTRGFLQQAAIGLLLALAAPTAAGGLSGDVVFTEYSPLSRTAELARRLSVPEPPRRGPAGDQPVDLAAERFALYVPDEPPPAGYGLLVFVPPWPEAKLPARWSRVLDKHHMIFVSAAGSGNDANVPARRAPLALLGYENVRRRYRIDPQRVYVGGFSGGARTALQIALGYPDVFHGVLLNAGSDPVGEGYVSLPPAELFGLFQASTRLAYVSGERDTFYVRADIVSRRSMREHCVFNVSSDVTPRVGHEVAGPAALDHALDALDAPPAADPAELERCRARLAAGAR